MNKFLVFFLALLLTSPAISQDSIITLLPDPFILPGLQASGEPEVYKGNDLFDLINNGTDVYFEYGFVKVAIQAYSGMKGNSSLKVEIYEMENSDGAYGIFSLTASQKKIEEKRGVFTVTGNGYKMIQKGPYFIIISYGNLTDELSTSLMTRITDDIVSKIKPLAYYPSLLTSNKIPCPNYTRILYFQGDIALSNATYLNFKIPFDYSDGVFYRCDVFDYIVYKPKGDLGMKKIMDLLITSIVESNAEFSPLQTSFGYSVKEGDKLRYDVSQEGETIILIKYI